MKKLSLLFLTLFVAMTTMASASPGTPLRVDESILTGMEYHVYQRTDRGSAVNPMTHTTCVPQDGYFETLWFDGGAIVFIKNIVYGSELEFGDYWVEGYCDMSSNRIYVELGQPILERQADGTFIRSSRRAVLAWGSVNYNASTGRATFTRDAAVTTVSYVMDDKTIHIEGTSGPVAIEDDDTPYITITATHQGSYQATGLAVVWEGETEEWAGYLEWGTEVDITSPIVIDEQPQGELKTYQRTSDCFTYNNWAKGNLNFVGYETRTSDGAIVFAPDGRTVYLKDPIQTLSYGTWIRGTLSDNGTVITIPLEQFLTQDTKLQPGHIYRGEQSHGAHYDFNVGTANGYHTARFIIEGNTISLDETETEFIEPANENFYASGLHAFDPTTGIGVVEANIVYQLKSEDPSKTSQPLIKGYPMDNGTAHLVEIVEAEPSTIYYRVQYPDGQYTAWTRYTEILSFSEAGTYLLEAYAQASDKLPSETVDYNFEIVKHTGVDEMTAGKHIVNKRFFNIMGQEIQQPDGLTIVVTTYSDGTTTAVKAVK